MSHYKSIYYKGLEYDITQFIQKHPGGKQIIENYLRCSQEITLIFKSIHSKQAEQTLFKLKADKKVQRSKNEKIYLKIQERVSKLYELSYFLEISIAVLLPFLCLIPYVVSNPIISVLCLTLSQIIAAWSSHSQLHSRIQSAKKIGKFYGAIILGLSWKWWIKKHNIHHIFTNNDQYDEDIKHSYLTIVFPFLLIKWRIESIIHSIFNISFVESVLIGLHYYILFKLKLTFIFLSMLMAGFFIAVVVFGNHQRERRYRREHLDDFLNHQMETTTDYENESECGLVLLGGFQYHVEHHLFPQIPFYNLGEASKIIREELNVYKKAIKVSTLM